MATLEEQFQLAAAHFRPIHGQFPDKVKLKMYGLYRQAKDGDISEPTPSRFDLVKQAKHNAWKKCKGMPKDLAMKRYISELRSLDPVFSLPTDKKEAAPKAKTPTSRGGKAAKQGSKGSKTALPLQEEFKQAAYFVRHTNRYRDFKKQRVLLYSYYKQATEGVNTRKAPSRFAGREAYAKWRAWGNLYDMSKEEAMQKYVEQVRKIVPEFDGREESVKVLLNGEAGTDVASTSKLYRQGSATQMPSFTEDVDDSQIAEMLMKTSPKVLKDKLDEAVATNKQIAFITGATGFLGKHFLDRLLNKNQYLDKNHVGIYGRYLDFLQRNVTGTQTKVPDEVETENILVILFVRKSSKQKMVKQILDRNGKGSVDKVLLLDYELGKPDYGLDPAILAILQATGLKKFNEGALHATGSDRARLFHFAAKYDLKESEEANRIANVEGTRMTIQFCKNLGLKLEYISSIVVAGDYNGMYLESSFTEGQQFDNPYAETKYLAEKLVRQDAKNKTFRYTIYRPGVVVGHSITGEADKIDGPYYIFKTLQKLRNYFPESVILPFIEGEAMPIVPVDYVVNAIHHISTKCDSSKTDKRAFHLVDSSAPNSPDSFLEALNIFAKAAHCATFSSRLTTVLVSFMPRKLMTAIQDIPILKESPAWFARNVLQIPPEVVYYLSNRTSYDDSDTQVLLAGSNIRCPSLGAYANVLWDYYERHLDLKNIDKDQALENEVKGKNVVITGASDGIGLALAHKLAARKANIFIVARNPDKIKKCVGELQLTAAAANTGNTSSEPAASKPTGKIKGYIADLSQEDPTNSMIDQILKENGHIDLLVNNAGRSIRRSVEYQYKGTGRFHDFERTMALNYYGALRCILGFLPGMRDRKQGQIINISTIGAVTNAPRFGAYVASKAALDGFTRCVSSECANDNVHFSTVYMPLVKTKMIESKGNDYTKYGGTILSVDEACELIVEAILEKHRTVATVTGKLVSVLYFLMPSAVESMLSIMYRLEPESAPRGVEASATAQGDREQLKAVLSVLRGAI